MKAKFIVLILLQLLLLVGIIGYREYWIAVGEKVLLRTAPVDPRDLFRGDYVRLSYDITSLDLDRLGVKESFKTNQTIYVTLDKEENGTCKASGVSSVPPTEGARFIQGRVRYQQPMQRWQVTVQDRSGILYILWANWFSGMNRGDRAVLCVGRDNRVLTHYKEDSPYKPKCENGASLEGLIVDIKDSKYQQVTAEYGIESYFLEEGKGRAIERSRNARDLKVEVALRDDGKGIITNLVMDGAMEIR